MVLYFYLIKNVVRAVARKSTSKICKPIPIPSATPLRVDDSAVNAEHKGRSKFRPNESYQKVDFEPHQCGSKCVEEFPYADGDHKSINYYSLTVHILETKSFPTGKSGN